jgi:hypothetical protein
LLRLAFLLSAAQNRQKSLSHSGIMIPGDQAFPGFSLVSPRSKSEKKI